MTRADMVLMADDFAGTDTTLAMLCVMGAVLAAEAVAMAIDAGQPRLIIYVNHGELANNPIVVGHLTMAISDDVCTYSSASTGTHTEPLRRWRCRKLLRLPGGAR